MPRISVVPDETVTLKKGYYCGIHIFLNFKREDVPYRKEEQADMNTDPDEEEVE